MVENLISNALEKAKYQPDTHISVTIYDNNETGYCIDVLDTGLAMDSATEQDLFKKHVTSENGMGVGLYHAAYDAKQAGYTLSLAHNEDGAVCFRLALNGR